MIHPFMVKSLTFLIYRQMLTKFDQRLSNMTIKKGDLVVPTGVLKEVVDFLASAEGEKLRLLKAFLDGDEPVKDAKYLLASRKVNKIYKDSLEVTFSKDYVWEERKEYWT